MPHFPMAYEQHDESFAVSAVHRALPSKLDLEVQHILQQVGTLGYFCLHIG